MATLLVRHRVRDYARWKDVFDSRAGVRADAGSLGGIVFRDGDDPEDVIVVMEWDDLDRARDFAERDDLAEAMDRAGVMGQPEFVFLVAVDGPKA
ncbi:MAG: cyclase [Gemmatimonadota bacterium]